MKRDPLADRREKSGASTPLRVFSALSESVRARCDGIFTDLDDTLSTGGKVTAAAYRALERLHQSGVMVIVITGRPAGWCDHLARMWPVTAVIGENGALYMIYDAHAKRLRKVFAATDLERRGQRVRLMDVAAAILREVPGAALASDQAYRETDVAIDFCEDVPPLGSPAIDRIVALMRARGMNAKVSSIHVNGWFGNYDKLTMTERLMREELGIDLDSERERFIFIGDSPNDAPMFDYFPYSVGVANVRHFLDRIDVLPKFVTVSEAGAGFVEVANAVLAARARRDRVPGASR